MMKFARIKTVTWNLVLITVGSVLCTIAINGILIPQQFISGGFTGLAILIHYLVPFSSVGVAYFILNIPIYALGWKFVGRRFFLYSIAGLFIFSAMVTWIHPTVPIQDKFLSALLAGIVSGVGAGIILRSLGSAGGLDILSIILIKKFSIRIGSSILAFNCILLLVFAFIFSMEAALYALIFIFVSSKLVDLVVTGLSQRKTAVIISEAWNEISREIINTLQRGVTVVCGQGAYSGQEKHILYVVITFQELSRLKRLIRQIDSSAFVVISDTLEVMGRRIGNQPHW
ncbi:MAG: YitT family protein [Deltaproteobacteria bacterium]|nr:MAG: YitT family protein [Deltaproteobacteria bacterium]